MGARQALGALLASRLLADQSPRRADGACPAAGRTRGRHTGAPAHCGCNSRGPEPEPEPETLEPEPETLVLTQAQVQAPCPCPWVAFVPVIVQ